MLSICKNIDSFGIYEERKLIRVYVIVVTNKTPKNIP